MSDIVTQTKLILPGSQIENFDLTDVNNKYFIYCSTFSIFIFDRKDFELRNILGDNPDKYISAISLGQSPSEELLAVYYYQTIVIYNLFTNKSSFSIPFNGVKAMKFNQNSNLLILNNKGELFISKIDYNEKKSINKIRIEEGICTCFKWYPFNSDELAYSTDKNKIYYYSITKNNNNIDNNTPFEFIKSSKAKYVHIKDDENFIVTIMEFYDLDENYKYLLVGTSNSKIYLLDLINYEITNKFNKYGKTPIQYLFWLNNQPGSFISINEKIGRYIKWNVSRTNYTSIGKISDVNLTSCVKFDNNSKFLTTNGNGELAIINLIDNKNIFQIKDNHYQCIYDLKINPNNDDLFITASFDGNIKLYSIKNNYGLICNFNTNNNLNNIKPISPSLEENNFTSTRLGGNYNIDNTERNHVICLKWAPNHSNLFASGDSFLNLRIFDISIKKQIILYKCMININKNQNKKNIIIHGIDWNSKDNILVGLNNHIFLFSFIINNNTNDKYSLILINEIRINSLAYNLVFEPNDENIIIPCDDGKIYFYKTTKDKADKIIDINSSPSIEISGHLKGVYQVIFNNSNTLMASSSDDMRIGLYDIEKSQSTPRSKLTTTISKFLVGQDNPIRQMLFLIDDTLISGSWNGVICIWNIHKYQLIYKLSENQSDIYGLSVSKKTPFKFATAGRDGIIRFWNLNYKFNIEKLLGVDKDNKKEIENLLEAYFPEENYDDFFNLLNSSNKEKVLIDNILKKEEYIKNEFSKYNLNSNDLGINNKIDYSLKQTEKNNIIDSLIEESAVIGSWKIFCELCILRNRWEDAICFAPKVSLKYWEFLMNKYEEYINSEDYAINNKNIKDINNNFDIDEIKLIGLINGKNYKKIIDLFIKEKDFQNALIVWLMNKSNNNEIKNKEDMNKNYDKDMINLELDLSDISKLISNEKDKNNIYNNIKKNLNEDENIIKIFDEEASILLKEGKRIKSIINYMYLEDKFMLFKTLYKSYFIELGYLFCDFDDKENNSKLKYINDFYILFLYDKYKPQVNDKIIPQLINKLFDEDFKNILCQKLTDKNQNGVLNIISNNNKSQLLSILENNDMSLYKKLIDKYKQECFITLSNLFLDKENKIAINETEIKEISIKLSEYQKFLMLLKLKEQEISINILNDIIYTIMFFECLNYNYKSLICLIIEYFISKNIIDIKKENNNNILIFIFSFVNYIQNNFKENYIVKEYKFNYIHQQKYNLLTSVYNKNLINFDKFTKVRKMLNFNDFYKCDINEMKFFYLQNEVYPRKVNIDDKLSTFSNSNIRSNIVLLMSGNYASQSEFLEMNKFLYIK